MRYDVALSYASEQTHEAESIARCLAKRGYVVFYAPDAQHLLIGQPLGSTLAKIYEHESRYCVVIVSEEYIAKEDPQWELDAAVSRHKRERHETGDGYILPFRVHDVLLDKIPTDTLYGDLVELGSDGVCAVIAARLGPSSIASTELDGFEVDPSPAIPLPPPSPHATLVQPFQLMVVLQKDNPTGPVLNVDCLFANQSSSAVTIDRLAGRLIDPNGLSCQLDWKRCYSTGPVMFPTDDSFPFSLSPSEQRVLGVQLVGPPSIHDYVWPIGSYGLQIDMEIHDGPEQELPLRRQFAFDVGAYHANGLAYWRRGSELDWERLNDPHDAVGIPIRLSE